MLSTGAGNFNRDYAYVTSTTNVKVKQIEDILGPFYTPENPPPQIDTENLIWTKPVTKDNNVVYEGYINKTTKLRDGWGI